jgi:transposase
MARPQGCLTRTPTNDELRELRRRTAARGIPRRDHQRAVIVLAVINGTSLAAAGRRAGCCENTNTAAFWCRRFHAYGLDGLVDRPKSGAPPWYGPAERQRVLDIGRMPPNPRRDGTATWSLELLTRRLHCEPGLEHIDPTTVRRFFVEAGLSWQADRSFCTSTDPQLAEKARLSRTPMPR